MSSLQRLQQLWRHHGDWLILAVVVIVAIAVRTSFANRVPVFVSKDSQSYFLPSWDLVQGNAFVLGLRRTPGYPIFLAVTQLLLGPELIAITYAQHALGVGTAAFSCLLGRLAFGRVAGLIAGLLVACSAPLVIYEHYVLTESLFTFALTGAMLILVSAMRSPRHRAAYVAGLALGLAALVRPVGQLIAPIALAAIAASRLPHWRPALIATGICAVGLATALVPWAIRNRLTNELGSTTTFGRTLIARTAYYDRGFTFYAPGWGDEGDPRLVTARKIVQEGANRRQPDGTIAGRLREELGLGPVEVNGIMRDIATEAILKRPDYFVFGSIKFAWVIFEGKEERVRNHLDEVKDVTWDARTRHLLPSARLTPEQDRTVREAQQIVNLYQPARHAELLALLCALGIAGALLRPGWRVALPIAAAALAHVVLSAALDGPQERYRYTVDPLISVSAAGGVAALAWLGGAILAALLRASPWSPRPADAAATR